MKISGLSTRIVRIPLKSEYRMVSALGRQDESEFALVRLETSAGVSGIGEATVTPAWSGETASGAAAIIEQLFAPALRDCEIHSTQDIHHISARMQALAQGNWFAKAAVEMACWDALGKYLQQPVYELLGGNVRPLTIRSRFSLGAYEPQVAAARAAERVAAGFHTIKIKTGTGNEADIARVCAVRKAVGDDIELTVDANGGWTYADAVECLRAIKDQNIALVEQPLERGSYTRLHQLRKTTGVRVLADESCFDEIQLYELIEHDCIDAVTLYPGKQAGISRAVRMAEAAEQYGIPCTVGSNLEWDIGAAAMMHFVVATRNIQVEKIAGDCLGPSYHEFSIARNPLQIDGPFTTLPTNPGLGVDVNEDLLDSLLASS